MTETELIACVADRVGLSRTQTHALCKAMADEVSRVLLTHGEVSLFGLGKLKRADYEARQGRNPKTGAVLTIPAKRTAKFSASSKLKAVLNESGD